MHRIPRPPEHPGAGEGGLEGRTGHAFRGKQVAFTGRLASMTREEAAAAVRSLGGSFARDVSRRTSFLVVGEDGWPLQGDGRLTRKLIAAEKLRARGAEIAVLGEDDFLERLGLEDRRQAIHRLYTTRQLARILNVPGSRLRMWVRAGLLTPARTVHRLSYFDFKQAAGARRLHDLISAGVEVETIRRSLAELRRWLPLGSEPLEQLALVEAGGRVLARLRSGELVEPGGQLCFDFVLAGRREGSVQDLEKRDDRPRGKKEWLDLAVAHEEAGRLKEAEAAYREALRAGGPDAEAQFNLGNVLYALGAGREACENFARAVEIDPLYVEAWNNYGNVLAELGAPEEALEAYGRALAVEPHYADAHFNLAETLDQMGRGLEARAHWQAYLRQDPRSPWAAQARERLRALDG